MQQQVVAPAAKKAPALSVQPGGLASMQASLSPSESCQGQVPGTKDRITAAMVPCQHASRRFTEAAGRLHRPANTTQAEAMPI